jgi:hypothetical protein
MVEPNYRVFLELQRRNEFGSGKENRISLLATDVTISTNKTVMNIGVPFSGAVRGESLNLAMDIGMAQKTISIQGILIEQEITKRKDPQEKPKVRKFTSFELAQLIHSYVDASTFQDDQNLNKVVILIPSRVNHEFNYHNSDAETKDISELDLIPFSWKNREYDNDFTAGVSGGKSYFTPITITDEDGDLEVDENNQLINTTTLGITGFIRSFSTTISGQEFPSVQFQLEFEEAMVLSDNFLD